jgi:hypothetical protein
MEQRLLAAGFIQVPADTVEKAANLQRLPPYKLVKRKTKGQDIYVYADPTKCKCAYIGDPSQYAVFKDALSSMPSGKHAINARMDTQEQMEGVSIHGTPVARLSSSGKIEILNVIERYVEP